MPLRRVEVAYDAIVVIINLGPPIAVRTIRTRRSFVAGLHDRAALTEHPGEQLGIQLDLTPLGAQMLLGPPMGELSRQVVDLDARAAATTLVERLGDAPDWETASSGSTRSCSRGWRGPPAAARRRLRLGPAGSRPTAPWASRRCAPSWAAAAATWPGASRRTSGCAPKGVARVLRFRRALALLHARRRPARFGDIAAAGGYYDQPHLNREFRALAGCTPGEYLARAGCPRGAASRVQFRGRERGAHVAAAAAPATSSGSVLRSARLSTNAPSSEASIEIAELARALARAMPGLDEARGRRRRSSSRRRRRVAWRSGSFVLATSSATVAIGQASA